MGPWNEGEVEDEVESEHRQSKTLGHRTHVPCHQEVREAVVQKEQRHPQGEHAQRRHGSAKARAEDPADERRPADETRRSDQETESEQQEADLPLEAALDRGMAVCARELRKRDR
jgi:hypothetical protein